MKFDGKQCKACPFRPGAVPGWLGSYDANSVFSSIWKGEPFFCHTQVNYKNPKWLDRAMRPHGGPLCAGGLVFAKKIHAARSEHEPIRIARDRVELIEGIECMTPKDFFALHRDSPEAQAWARAQEEREERRSARAEDAAEDAREARTLEREFLDDTAQENGS